MKHLITLLLSLTTLMLVGHVKKYTIMRKINKSIICLLAFTFLSCNQTKSNIEEKANTTKISETTESEKGKNKIIEDVNTEIAKGSKGEESPPIKEVKSVPKPIKFIVKEKIKKVPVLDEHEELEVIEESKVTTTTVDEKCYYKYDMSPVTGTVIGHHENGQLKVKATYKDGIPDGLYKQWRENGRLRFEMTYKNGKRNGLFRSWNYGGGLYSKRIYVNGDIDGISNAWFYDGILSITGNYLNGKKEGVHKIWSLEDHSILWSLDTYKNGQKDGESKFWDSKTGELIYIRIYKGGKLVEETKYKYK